MLPFPGISSPSSSPPSLEKLYPQPHKRGNPKKPSSGFRGLIDKSRSRVLLNPEQVKLNPAPAAGKASI